MQPLRLSLAAALLVALSGCSLFSGPEKPPPGSDEALKLPPELERADSGQAMDIPEGAATTADGGSGEVLPQPRQVDVRRVGADRWVTVDAPPREVWGWLAEFLEGQGVAVGRRNATAGVLETEWLYTRKPLSRGPFAPTVEGPEEATVADRYLLRVEPGEQGGTSDVFVAHRRAARRSDAGWQLLDPDPFLEAEVLRGLVVYLGVEADESFQRVAGARRTGTAAELARGDDGELRLVLPDGFMDAWRRVGLALDRAGFTVETRNRDERRIDLRYDTRAGKDPEEAGFFESLAFWRDETIPATVRTFRLRFADAGDGSGTRVSLEGLGDKPVTPERREEILGLIGEQIR